MYPKPLGKGHEGMILNVLSWSTRFFGLYIVYRPWVYGDSYFSIEIFEGTPHKACRYIHFWNWNPNPDELWTKS